MGHEESGHSNELSGSGESFVQARDVSGGIHFHAPRAPRPRQLPLPIGDFTGRESELAELDALLGEHFTAVVVSAVSGTAGVGKTALAIHWAHRVRDRFPDGQLYVDLRGYDRELPLEHGDVLSGFLRALSVVDVPNDVEERAALYRSLVADRRVLVVLDNARTASQVLPLLPGSPGCFVIVTSRDALPELRVRYGARGVDLDRLPPDDAVRLLRTSIGRRVDESPDDAVTLVELCARLPLALRIAAEVAVVRPRASLGELVTELAGERRLLGLAQDDRTIRTVFSWSFRQLDDDCRELFRVLGLHPGRRYDTASVAVLASVDEAQADRLLDALARVHLVEAGADGRFGMHDLLTAYAREQAETLIDREAADRAFSRLFEHYATKAHAALDADVPAWFETERLNLVVVAKHAALRGVPAYRVGAYERDLALLTRMAGDIPRALRYFDRALKTCRTSASDLVDRIQLDQAETMIAAGLYSEACSLLDDLRARLRSTDPLLARLDQLHAVAELARGNADRAIGLAAVARVRFTDAGDDRAATTCALTHLAALTAEPDRLTEDERSTTYQRLSTTAAELTRAGLPDEAAFALLLGVRLVIANGDVDLAVTLMPESSARRSARIDYRLLLQLCWAEIAFKLGKGDDVLFEAETAFELVNHERSAELSPVPVGALYRRRLRDLALDVVVRRREAGTLLTFTERARVQRLKYAPARPVAEAVTLDQVVHVVGDRALVSFVAVSDELFALVVTAEGTRIVELGPAEVIVEPARRMYSDINAVAPNDLATSLVAVIAASAERQAHTLDVLLMRPLAEHIADRDLVVVPTGPLYSVTWSALATLRGRSVVVAPSITAWLTSEAAPSPPRPDRVVLAAGPGVPAAAREIDDLARLHVDPTVLPIDQAKVAAVLKACDGAAVVHLAAFAVNEPENALFSRLEFIDGPLLAHEFSEMHHPPGLVVLAACELAGGHVEPDGDALGFADAMLLAGVSTVIVAIGRVGDETTAIAMHDFHQALAAGLSPARALAKAVAVDPLRRPFICVGSGKA
ncbi:CHAT domain-containing protein [Actinosynnema sp. NPDC050801]|uniref:CHAT domain-containing protein n=1 Tax=unclassified Actinosynnema TaxID=2637065 RepID=UPI0033CB94A3